MKLRRNTKRASAHGALVWHSSGATGRCPTWWRALVRSRVLVKLDSISRIKLAGHADRQIDF
jgi:hypothetical protein